VEGVPPTAVDSRLEFREGTIFGVFDKVVLDLGFTIESPIEKTGRERVPADGRSHDSKSVTRPATVTQPISRRALVSSVRFLPSSAREPVIAAPGTQNS